MFSKTELEDLLTKIQFSDGERARTGGINTYPPLIEDLWSLYENIVKRRVVSILEYGSGWSTLVLALALEHNKKIYGDLVSSEIRHPNPFHLMTVDSSRSFSKIAVRRAEEYTTTEIVSVVSKSKLVEIESQICNVFTNVPPFTADFVYIDGPDSSQVKGTIRGFHPRFGDRERKYGMPMTADLIGLEFFLWPGSTIVVDGRGANANFLRKILKRDWQYSYNSFTNQHFFDLVEPSWGKYSQKLLELKNKKD